MCNRLDKFLVDKNLIHETKIGFKKNSRTSDHIFVLNCLIEKYFNSGNKKLFACFVDFRKAFDKITYPGIMYKLLSNGIGGFYYKMLKSMYCNDQLCVKINDKMTDFFTYQIGLRQGDV